MIEDIRIKYLNTEIKRQIKNICAADYSNFELVEEFPFFAFHVWFKKSALEQLFVDALKKGEVTLSDLSDCISIFKDKKASMKFNGIPMENFKTNIKNYSKFNTGLFVEYTERLTTALQNRAENYQEIVDCLCACSNEELSIDSIIYDGEYNDDWLDGEVLTADDELDSDCNVYRWKELRLTGKDGEPFYYFNSEMYRLFFRSKKILGQYSQVDAVHTREPEAEISNTSKTKKKTEETSRDLTPKESREEYLRLLNVNTKVIDKESTTILKYYKSMYSVLTHEYFNLDKKLIGDILDNTLTGLLKRQLNLSINTALSKFKHITIEDLAKICGSSKEALNNQLYQLENTMLPMQHLYLISTVLGVPSSQLLGTTPPPSTIPTDEVDAKDK